MVRKKDNNKHLSLYHNVPKNYLITIAFCCAFKSIICNRNTLKNKKSDFPQYINNFIEFEKIERK